MLVDGRGEGPGEQLTDGSELSFGDDEVVCSWREWQHAS